MSAVYFLLGGIFGVLLSRSGAADYNYIQAMFLFESFQLYGIIGTAVLLTALGIAAVRKRGRTIAGAPIAIETKVLHPGTIAGGVMFGIGWSMAGMCPGPIFVNIGEGKIYALPVLAGALVGAGVLGRTYAVLQHVLRLPSLSTPFGAASHSSENGGYSSTSRSM